MNLKGMRVPIFSEGNILTGEMLEEMKEYTMGFAKLSYIEYGKGILKGCNLTATDSHITLHPGIVICFQEPILITVPVEIPYDPVNRWTALKLEVDKAYENRSFSVRNMSLNLTEDLEPKENTIELCRFRLQKGAKLRTKRREFKDCNTEFDTINQIYSEWAAYKETSFSPEILRCYAEELMKSEITNPWDMVFVQQIFNHHGEPLERKAIQMYLSQRLGEVVQEWSNVEIFHKLSEVLEKAKGEIASPVRRQGSGRRIMVD